MTCACRGRSTWPAPAQAAEIALREEHGILGLDALDVVSHEETAEGRWVSVLSQSSLQFQYEPRETWR